MNGSEPTKIRYGIAIAAIAVLAACAPEIVEERFEPAISHQEYRAALELLDLDDTALGQSWIAAAEAAVAEPLTVETPFEEVVLFDPHEPRAIGYEFVAERGRAVTVSMETGIERYYADLFRVEAGSGLVMVASRPAESSEIRFEPRRDGRYLLRVQPELLRGGRVVVRIVATASLAFPVEAVGPGQILSYFGDGRDGGLRIHEGVDIFAPRGTPLLAASDAVVHRVGVRDRGGNIVSLYDEKRDLLLYYAHLEEQMVRQGERVTAGQVIGTVGNTGNAITTPPHLHIGVYQGGWQHAVDPWNYFVDPPLTVPQPALHEDLLGSWHRLAAGTSLRVGLEAPAVGPRWINRNPLLRVEGAGDSRGSGRLESADAGSVTPPIRDAGGTRDMPADTPLLVVGAAGSVVRVRTPDGDYGYMDPSPLASATEMRLLEREVGLRDPVTGDLFRRLSGGGAVEYLGSYEGRIYLRTEDGRVGFVDA